MKRKLCILFTIIIAALFATPVFATQNSDKAIKIVQTLERYQVSPNWKADLNANKDMLEDLATIVDNFDFEDAEQLGEKKQLVSQYYEAYNALIGSSKKFPQEFKAAVNASDSFEAVEILTKLANWQVDPTVRGDIVANVEDIEKMLNLVFTYSEEEISKISLTKQNAMLQYFISLYNYRGWDVKELDLVFTKSQIPLSSITYILPKTQQVLPPITKVAPKDEPFFANSITNDYSSVIGAIVGFVISAALLTFLAIVLKHRNEKKYHS